MATYNQALKQVYTHISKKKSVIKKAKKNEKKKLKTKRIKKIKIKANLNIN